MDEDQRVRAIQEWKSSVTDEKSMMRWMSKYQPTWPEAIVRATVERIKNDMEKTNKFLDQLRYEKKIVDPKKLQKKWNRYLQENKITLLEDCNYCESLEDQFNSMVINEGWKDPTDKSKEKKEKNKNEIVEEEKVNEIICMS